MVQDTQDRRARQDDYAPGTHYSQGGPRENRLVHRPSTELRPHAAYLELCGPIVVITSTAVRLTNSGSLRGRAVCVTSSTGAERPEESMPRDEYLRVVDGDDRCAAPPEVGAMRREFRAVGEGHYVFAIPDLQLELDVDRLTARSRSVRNKAGFIGEKKWCRGAESKYRHHDFQSDATGPLASASFRRRRISSVIRSALGCCDPPVSACGCLPFVYQDAAQPEVLRWPPPIIRVSAGPLPACASGWRDNWRKRVSQRLIEAVDGARPK